MNDDGSTLKTEGKHGKHEVSAPALVMVAIASVIGIAVIATQAVSVTSPLAIIGMMILLILTMIPIQHYTPLQNGGSPPYVSSVVHEMRLKKQNGLQ